MTSVCLVTPRDRDLFQALDRSPLTVRQILKLSETFAYPFTTERRVQERLQALGAAGRVRQWPYATAGHGALSYYTLTPLGYRLLHGHDVAPGGRGLFGPVGVARQAHTLALAEVLVHLGAGAFRAGAAIEDFRRENTLRLSAGDDCLYPDGAFALRLPSVDDCRFRFFLELDNRSESVWPGSSLDSWGKKVQFYERYQDAEEERFRVVTVTTGGPGRLGNMLRCAADHARNIDRSLVCGITLQDLLDAEDPLRTACYLDHQGKSVPLLPAKPVSRRRELTAPSGVIRSAACLRPQPVA
jgi:hypothetical protein